MKTADLKLEIISKIADLKDIRVIEEIKRLLDFELSQDIYELSSEQVNAIEESRNDYIKGAFLNEDDANNETNQWLNEK